MMERSERSNILIAYVRLFGEYYANCNGWTEWIRFILIRRQAITPNAVRNREVNDSRGKITRGPIYQWTTAAIISKSRSNPVRAQSYAMRALSFSLSFSLSLSLSRCIPRFIKRSQKYRSTSDRRFPSVFCLPASKASSAIRPHTNFLLAGANRAVYSQLAQRSTS